jgi:hypothetical protein
MSEPTPFALSHHLTALVGRKVAFTQTAAGLDGPTRCVYGIYNVLPHEAAVVVKADLALLGSLVGVLMGLPDAAVKDLLKISPIDEMLSAGINEVLSITSTVVTTEGRAVFTKMATETTAVDGAARQVLQKPGHRSNFDVTVDGYQGGRFSIFSPLRVLTGV